jgi:UDP-glucose 4-epimerase
VRVLVTGGAGFIGQHLVSGLLAQGDQPIVIDSMVHGSQPILPDGVSLIDMDITAPGTPEVIASLEPDAIVHAAAQVSVARSMADPELDRAVNVLGTEAVIEGARKSGNVRLIFISTGGAIYGETSRPATEETPPNPKSYYGAHKYLAERYVELSGLPYAIVRLANVYGPGQRKDLEGGVVSIFADRLRGGLPITIHGDGNQSRDLIHVHDVVSAIQTLIGFSGSGLWNIGTGIETSINQLLATMELAFNSAASKTHTTTRPGDVIRSCLDSTKIQQETGWAPRITVEAGVRLL